jgi:hypothetical protein
VPQAGFLFSIAGLSFTLVGFSGLIAALGRDGQRTSLLVYRLRQIPEMALASALIALISVPLVDLAGSPMLAIRIASARLPSPPAMSGCSSSGCAPRQFNFAPATGCSPP